MDRARALSATSPARRYVHGVRSTIASSIWLPAFPVVTVAAAIRRPGECRPFHHVNWLMMIFVRDRNAACRRREQIP